MLAVFAAWPSGAVTLRRSTADEVDALVEPYLEGGIVNAISDRSRRWRQELDEAFRTTLERVPSKPSDSTIYEIGSMSKVFTGILLAHAVETGRVQLDQPIGAIMTELQAANKEVGDTILLRHLATHTSGLPRLPEQS